MRKEGVGKVAYVRYRSLMGAIDITLSSNFDFVFYSIHFHVRRVKQKLIDDVHMQQLGPCYFFTLIMRIPQWRTGHVQRSCP